MFASLKSLTKLLSSFQKISWDLYYECQVVDIYNLTFHDFYDFVEIKFDIQKLKPLEIEISTYLSNTKVDINFLKEIIFTFF